jgi:hypothetical protein
MGDSTNKWNRPLLPALYAQLERNIEQMGMFAALPKNFTDHFREGEVFKLDKAEVVSIPTQEYGNQDAVTMTIDGEQYSIFGAGLVGQVNRMSSNDLPARVSVQRAKSKRGTVKMFVPEGQSLEDMGATPLDNTPSTPDNATPVGPDDFTTPDQGSGQDQDIPF